MNKLSYVVKNTFIKHLTKKERVDEIAEALAPAALSIIRFNQRAVPVLSYVSQLGVPCNCKKLHAVAQHALHRIRHMPPNCMSRELTRMINNFSLIPPTHLPDYQLSAMF